jgi:hypothetical protein
MLRAHCPIRTVEEEQQEIFKDATPCPVPATTFTRTVDRALRACFALLKFTDHIQVVYVQGSTGKVDVYFDKGRGMLNIHCRWLDFACTHYRSFCRPWSPSNLADPNAPFFCYVVEELLVRSIASMFKAHATARPTEMKFMRQIGRRLRHLPHSIKLKAYPGGILVSWEDNDTEAFRTLGPNSPGYHVVLHDDNCVNAETALLHDKAGKWSSIIQGTTAQPLIWPSQVKWCPVAAASCSLAGHTECASLPVCPLHRYIMP